jgi:cyanate lyase
MPIFLRSALLFSKLRLEKVIADVLLMSKIKMFNLNLLTSRFVGMTFDQIAKAIGRDEVWVAAAFYGQVKFGF